MLDTNRCLVLACAIAGAIGVSEARGQVTIDNALIITEFFDEFRFVDPAGPSALTLFHDRSALSAVKFKPNELLLESTGTLLFIQYNTLRRLNPATGAITTVSEPSESTLSSIALEADGSVIATDREGVYRINAVTGQPTLIPNTESFYTPRYVTIAPNGDIYVNEFFERLLKIDPVTLEFSPVPVNVPDNTYGIAKQIEALPTGELAIVTFQNNIEVFNPDTGLAAVVPLDFELQNPRGTAIGSEGQFLIATGDGVYEIDLVTGVSTTLTPDETFLSPNDVVQGTSTILFDTDGDGDFDDADLANAFSNFTGPLGAAGGKSFMDGDVDGDGDVDDVDLGTLFSVYTGPLAPASVPEPASIAVLGFGALLGVRRRRC